jgi:hypothetical protein
MTVKMLSRQEFLTGYIFFALTAILAIVVYDLIMKLMHDKPHFMHHTTLMKHHGENYNQGLLPGASIKCENDPVVGAVYQYNRDHRYWYANPPVASSCNPNWSANIQTVDCSNIHQGADQLTPCAPPGPSGITLITQPPR